MWIKHCISTPRFSILVNGNPVDFLNSTRGLRQGDLLSSFPFVLVMDAMSRMIEAAVEESLLSGFGVGNESRSRLKVSHLLFANVTLIFSEANQEYIQSLRALLLCFEAVLGLRINLAKSEIVPVGFISNISGLTNMLGYKISLLPLRYLGFPLGAPHKSVMIWDGG